MKDYKLELYGHTDNLGTKEENYELGLKRAQKTKEALVSFGIDPKKIKVFSKGDSEPIATNKTSKGRLLNRRVEFKLIKGK
jgi:outer membrane protein OmpA-like peptidoglycan-associated protein